VLVKDDSIILTKMVKIGFSEREVKTYLALLDWPGSSAADIQRLAQVPRSKTYEILEKMVARGYCTEWKEGGKKFYRATSPESLQKLLSTQWTREIEKRQTIAQEVFDGLQARYRSTRLYQNLEKIEVIRNKVQINRQYITLLSETRHSLDSFNRSPYACVEPDVLKEQEKESKRCLDAGVEIRTIYMREPEHWDWLYPSIQRSIEEGEIARIAEYLPLKMYISDGKKVMMALPMFDGSKDSDFTMVILEDAGVCDSYAMLFETIWATALTLQDVPY